MLSSLFYNIFFDIFIFALILIFIGLTFIAVFREKKVDMYGTYSGTALAIVPCRGRDYSLLQNLRSIMESAGTRYNVIAVVDSEDDEAVPVIREAGIPFIISQQNCSGCSGKVRAIYSAIERFPDYPVYVIADSDILPPPNWLSDLLDPLSDPEVGISTTFPYFEPVGGFWSRVKLVWGFVGLGMMESSLTRFGWGGSLAFRKDLLDNGGSDFFRSYVSDDVALTKLCKSRGLKISYVAGAAPLVNSPDNFHVFMEWANRQTALSIYATPSVFRYGIIFYLSTIILTVSAITMAIFVYPLFIALITPLIITALRNVHRAGKMKVSVFLISLFIPFLYLYNLIRARRMSEITWRGRTYSLSEYNESSDMAK